MLGEQHTQYWLRTNRLNAYKLVAHSTFCWRLN